MLEIIKMKKTLITSLLFVALALNGQDRFQVDDDFWNNFLYEIDGTSNGYIYETDYNQITGEYDNWEYIPKEVSVNFLPEFDSQLLHHNYFGLKCPEIFNTPRALRLNPETQEGRVVWNQGKHYCPKATFYSVPSNNFVFSEPYYSDVFIELIQYNQYLKRAEHVYSIEITKYFENSDDRTKHTIIISQDTSVSNIQHHLDFLRIFHDPKYLINSVELSTDKNKQHSIISHIGDIEQTFLFDTGASITTLPNFKKNRFISENIVTETTRQMNLVNASGNSSHYNVYTTDLLIGEILFENIEVVFTEGRSLLGMNVISKMKDWKITEEKSVYFLKFRKD